nr:MerR family transcriptional regulator [uncultured Holophaga sp.]
MKRGELAKRGGCDIETIRHYERLGLLEAPERDPNGYRNYDEHHVVQLLFIRHCRSLDIGLEDIRILRHFQTHPDLACSAVNEVLDAQIRRIHERIQSLQQLELQLQALRGTCNTQGSSRDCGILRHMLEAAEGRGCPCHGPSADAAVAVEP